MRLVKMRVLVSLLLVLTAVITGTDAQSLKTDSKVLILARKL